MIFGTKIMGRLLDTRGGQSPLGGLVAASVRGAHRTYRKGVAGGNIPLRRVAEDRNGPQTGRIVLPFDVLKRNPVRQMVLCFTLRKS